MPLITLDQASLAFGHHPLLDHANLQLDAGERVGLIGRNGAGKSSLLKAIAGETEGCEASRFIAELPQDDVRHSGNPGGDPIASKEHGKERMAQIRAMLGKT